MVCTNARRARRGCPGSLCLVTKDFAVSIDNHANTAYNNIYDTIDDTRILALRFDLENYA